MSEEDSDRLGGGGGGYECIWKSVVCFAVKEATEAPRSDIYGPVPVGCREPARLPGSETETNSCVLDCAVVFGDWHLIPGNMRCPLLVHWSRQVSS